MKRLLHAVMCVVCALAVATPASAALLLNWDLYGVGTVIPGTPAGDQQELDRLNYLISLVNGTPSLLNPDGNIYAVDLGSLVITPIPYPATFNTGDKWATNNLSFTIPGGYSFDYLMAKYGTDDAFYYIGGLSGEIYLDSPIVGTGHCLSHISLYDRVYIPEPSTLLLLGSGLLGLVGYGRRRMKK